MELWDDLKDRAARFDDWRKRLTHELALLPDTLERLREGAVNFQVVGQRLARSSEALEEVTRLYETTLKDSTRRSAEAMESLRQQVEKAAKTASPERLVQAAGDIQKTITALAELNPFWPKGPSRSS
ncbi:MAG TPA: hypothetical protein VF855_04535 [Acidimicrobiales bacterium]